MVSATVALARLEDRDIGDAAFVPLDPTDQASNIPQSCVPRLLKTISNKTAAGDAHARFAKRDVFRTPCLDRK
jgi:hypothetical protein